MHFPLVIELYFSRGLTNAHAYGGETFGTSEYCPSPTGWKYMDGSTWKFAGNDLVVQCYKDGGNYRTLRNIFISVETDSSTRAKFFFPS